MRIKIDGLPDDLIERCKGCGYCIFEEILSKEQRKIKVLDKKVPKKHPHRGVIEQVCGREYDDVCPMKYAAMRAVTDDRTAMQLGVIKTYIWDMGKRYKKKIKYTDAIKKWTMDQFLGRDIKESRAGRYEEVWSRGIRNIVVSDKQVEHQLLTADLIYEIIMTNYDDYGHWLKMLNKLKKEHQERDAV
jgi:hypothetical protein